MPFQSGSSTCLNMDIGKKARKSCDSVGRNKDSLRQTWNKTTNRNYLLIETIYNILEWEYKKILKCVCKQVQPEQ